MNDKLYTQIKSKIKLIFNDDFSGHDYWHTIRVFKTARELANGYESNKTVICLAALLHDVDDTKLFPGHTDENARKLMTECNVDKLTQDLVVQTIGYVSYRKNGTTTPPTIEGQIVQDADRLDAIGAIGIARAFAYGGNHNNILFDPMCEEKDTISHFHEKLFKLANSLNTDQAKLIGQHRNNIMIDFMSEFNHECRISINDTILYTKID